ncbi:PTS sugar transporter subunit IIA [Companilactobacillus huachuanensis]|uniref:PTS sugar transporter subunit IIA n=1 Tax=Companilactobacillus huachuanensis TaxID=2559914 RepID=A0ABW1RL45_9LACO|nr:PTS sugar transporter subunit IIA [Companilactobacillus huachuanensis]
MSIWKKISDFLTPDSNRPTNDPNVTRQDQMSDFSRVLDVKNIVVDVQVKSRNELLKYLATLAHTNDSKIDVEALYGKYLVRESDASTDLGDGIAMPHAQDESVSKLTMLVVKLAQPIVWSEGAEVQTVISLVIPDPEKNYAHVPYMSSIARLLFKKGFISALNRTMAPEKISQLFI